MGESKLPWCRLCGRRRSNSRGRTCKGCYLEVEGGVSEQLVQMREAKRVGSGESSGSEEVQLWVEVRRADPLKFGVLLDRLEREDRERRAGVSSGPVAEAEGGEVDGYDRVSDAVTPMLEGKMSSWLAEWRSGMSGVCPRCGQVIPCAGSSGSGG